MNGGSPWQENKDSGSVFWFNSETGEVTAECPPELRPTKEHEDEEYENGASAVQSHLEIRHDVARRTGV